MAFIDPGTNASQLKMMEDRWASMRFITRGRPPAFACALSGMKAKRAAPRTD